jgi:hypothetical protein
VVILIQKLWQQSRRGRLPDSTAYSAESAPALWSGLRLLQMLYYLRPSLVTGTAPPLRVRTLQREQTAPPTPDSAPLRPRNRMTAQDLQRDYFNNSHELKLNVNMFFIEVIKQDSGVIRVTYMARLGEKTTICWSTFWFTTSSTPLVFLKIHSQFYLVLLTKART